MSFDKRVHSFLSHTAITLKFKRHCFPDEAGYSAEKVYTDINLPLLIPNEDKM